MFLGFNETCKHIEKLYEKSIPIVSVIIIPYVIIIWTLSVIISLTAWFFGFWRCRDCNKVFSPFKKKYKVYWCNGWDSDGVDKFCHKCKRMNEKESH